MMMFARRSALAVLAAFALLGAVFVAPAPVLASGPTGASQSATPHVATTTTCHTRGCDGQDPYATRCSADSVVVNSAPIRGMLTQAIYLYWSRACQSNWVAVYTDPDYVVSGWTEVDVYGTDPAAGQGDYSALAAFGCNCTGHHIWGNLIYSPGCARGHAYNSDGAYDAWIVQQGCP
jgi:hypothetical protein